MQGASRVLSSFNNKDAYSCVVGEQAAPPPQPSSSFNQDHMVFDHGSRVTTDEDFAFSTAAFMNAEEDAHAGDDHHHHPDHGGVLAGSGTGNDDGMTRDFLGLKPRSNSDILNIDNLHPYYYTNPNNTSNCDDHDLI